MIRSFFEIVKETIKDYNCIVAHESAADIMGLSNGGYREKIHVYSFEKINNPVLECHIISSLDEIDYFDFHGIRCTSINQTIIDLLNSSSTDEQILIETLANYYYENNQSFDNLNIPQMLNHSFQKYKDWSVEYYDTEY